MSELQNAHQLIEQAFEQARRSGKPEWWNMAIPVLKNRLLLLTDRKFREADFGARSFREFLRNASDTVEVHDAPLPGHVTLRSAAVADLPAEESKIVRREIRPDLWEAVLDFSAVHDTFGIASNSARELHVTGIS